MSEPAVSWHAAEASAPWPWVSGDLPDVNVWLALSHTQHPFHEAASRYWQTVCDSGIPLWFCRTTMMSLVRLLSQPKLMGAAVLDLNQAMAIYRQWLATPEVALLADNAAMDEAIEQLLNRSGSPHPARLWTDICLAATAQSAGLRLVTFDRDFERFGLERCLVLSGD